MARASEREPFPTDIDEFSTDHRIAFDRNTESYKLEDEQGEEWEWLAKHEKWVPVTDEALLAKQQEVYKVAGVDETVPAVDPKKRKAEVEETSSAKSKKQKADESRPERRNTAVYVSSLPEDVTEDELHQVFSKYGGVIAESADTGKPRVKLYYDESGGFKGDALIVFFKPDSVAQAINMLDETDLRNGMRGTMRVKEADSSYKVQKEPPLAGDQAKTKGTGANRDRQKIIKKNQEMNSRLADWDDDDPSVLPDTSSRWDKVVILKQMFTLKELADDPAALLDIKEDVREECEKFGKVTNVVLFDKEEDGVLSVRFGNAVSAQACIRKLDGRMFAGRKVEAYIADGSEKFKKSSKQVAEDDDDEERLEGFSKFIEGDKNGAET